VVCQGESFQAPSGSAKRRAPSSPKGTARDSGDAVTRPAPKGLESSFQMPPLGGLGLAQPRGPPPPLCGGDVPRPPPKPPILQPTKSGKFCVCQCLLRLPPLRVGTRTIPEGARLCTLHSRPLGVFQRAPPKGGPLHATGMAPVFFGGEAPPKQPWAPDSGAQEQGCANKEIG